MGEWKSLNAQDFDLHPLFHIKKTPIANATSKSRKFHDGQIFQRLVKVAEDRLPRPQNKNISIAMPALNTTSNRSAEHDCLSCLKKT